MKEDTIKLLIAAAAAALWSYAKDMIWPLGILLAAMVVDYISGVAAAWVNHELSSRVGIVGIVKKLSYLALVVVGCSIDYLINMLGAQLTGAEVSVRAIGLVVICWLIINELISILENVARQGGPTVPFLAPLLRHLKSSAEAQVPVSDSDTQPEGRHERRD